MIAGSLSVLLVLLLSLLVGSWCVHEKCVVVFVVARG
jgi:hypothetical protein